MQPIQHFNLPAVYQAVDQTRQNRLAMLMNRQKYDQDRQAMERQNKLFELLQSRAAVPDGADPYDWQAQTLEMASPYNPEFGLKSLDVRKAGDAYKQERGYREDVERILPAIPSIMEMPEQRDRNALLSGLMFQLSKHNPKISENIFEMAMKPQERAKYGNLKTDNQGRVWGVNETSGQFEMVPTVGGFQPEPEPLKAPPTRTRSSNGMDYQEELQPDGSWKVIGGKPTFAPTKDEKQKPPAGYRFKPDGTLEPIAGGPAEAKKDPTEFQAKAALYFNSMKQATRTLDSLEQATETSRFKEITPGVGEAAVPTETAKNVVRSKVRQRYNQAARQWIDSINRVRSGANLPEMEYERAVVTFFPAYGDSAETIRQKRAARAQEESSMRDAAGRALPQDQAAEPQTPNGGWGIKRVK